MKKEASELSCRLANNLRQWIVQVNKLVEDLERYNTDDQVAGAYRRLKLMHQLLSAELSIWDKYKKDPDRLIHATGDRLAKKLDTPVTINCIYFKGLGGVKKVSCCGGRTKEVPAYDCLLFGQIVNRDCRTCNRYIDGTRGEPKHIADYLVIVDNCDDCDRVKAAIMHTTVKGRRLHVNHFKTDSEARAYLDALGLEDLYAPCFIAGFDPKSRKGDGQDDDPQYIIGELKRLGYSGTGAGLPVDSCVFALEERGVERGEKQWGCELFEKTCRSKCFECGRHIMQSDLKSEENIDLLVGVKGNSETKYLLEKIMTTQGLRRELQVLNIINYEQAQVVMDAKFHRRDLHVPVLFTDYNLTTGECPWASDDTDEILDYLAREAYIQK